MDSVRAHVFVSGIVQGVFYRSSTRDEAISRGLTGWVRNLPDERVEAVFEGGKTPVEEMLKWCRRGPPGARVDGVLVSWEKPTGEYSSFRIIR
jgi:acylphosphatase